jgi:hypothetical protein
MKAKIFVAGILMICLAASELWAQPLIFSPSALDTKPYQQAGFSAPEQSALTLPKRPALYFADSLTATAGKPKRSVAKAMFFSAAIPGTGEFYNKSFLKGLAFLGIEVGAWVVYAHYTNLGNEKTDKFESYANLHWSESEYWRSLADDSKGKCSPGDMQCLRDYEHENFSHFLPDNKNQTYYENIGKYDQFNGGWDDSISGEARKRDSNNRELYTRMRKEANDQFKTAALGTSVVLINHVLSALDAAWMAYRFNQSQGKASMGMRMQRYDRELVPALSLTMTW